MLDGGNRKGTGPSDGTGREITGGKETPHDSPFPYCTVHVPTTFSRPDFYREYRCAVYLHRSSSTLRPMTQTVIKMLLLCVRARNVRRHNTAYLSASSMGGESFEEEIQHEKGPRICSNHSGTSQAGASRLAVARKQGVERFQICKGVSTQGAHRLRAARTMHVGRAQLCVVLLRRGASAGT